MPKLAIALTISALLAGFGLFEAASAAPLGSSLAPASPNGGIVQIKSAKKSKKDEETITNRRGPPSPTPSNRRGPPSPVPTQPSQR